MHLKLKNSAETLACKLQYDRKKLRFICPLPCAYDAETVGYAAARFIRHCPALRDRLVRQAVSAGLEVGRKVRPARVRIHADARSLALPGDDAYVSVSVTPGTVSIKSVRIAASGPRRARRAARRTPGPAERQ